MFKEYQVVRLKSVLPFVPVPLDAKGAILIVHEGEPLAYEVEFVTESGRSLGTFTVQDADLVAADQ